MQSLVSTLKNTFSSGKTRSLEWRSQQLRQLSLMISDNEAQWHEALRKDLGKCKAESVLAETGFLLGDIRHTLKHLNKWAKPRSVSTPLVAQPGKSYRLPEPLGTVLIIGAWNYPLQLVVAPYVAALAAGNCAVLKPSELSAHTSALLATLVPKYMDTSAVQVVEGGRDETTALLDCQWDHIFYTGGDRVGRIVMQAAAKYLTPVTLELGGKSPCIVDDNIDLMVAARRIAWGKWLNAGQTCVAPDYILVQERVKQPFLQALERAIEEQYGSDPVNNGDYGCIINEAHYQRLLRYLDHQTVGYGGKFDAATRKIAPTLVMSPAMDSPIMQEEIFGPLLPIITYRDSAEALSLINQRPKPLALYLFSNNRQFQDDVSTHTSAGNMCINDTMMFMTNPNLPFGGVGQSGMGSYHGQAGFDTFSHLKTVMKRPFWLDASIRYAPFTELKMALLKRLM